MSETGQSTIRRAIYAGSFDPITKGHQNIIDRASKMYDEVHVLVATNTMKLYTFYHDVRLDAVIETISKSKWNNVMAVPYNGFIVDYAKLYPGVLIRGVRGTADFDYEFGMAHNNQVLGHGLETVFIPCLPEYSHVSSTLVRLMLQNNQDIKSLVPAGVADILKKQKV